jgi:hypothetical protein
MMIHAVLFLVGALTLAGFACYICRGHPAAPELTRRKARERRTLQEIEWRLLAEADAPGSDNSHQID